MRNSIFRKANKLKKLVRFEAEVYDKAYFDVDGKKLCLAFNGHYHYWESCCCTHCSVHWGTAAIEGKVPLCSYKIAIEMYLSQK